MSGEKTRGERNNNPGNIDLNPHITWLGELGLETVPPGHSYRPRFIRFDVPEHGIRAIARVLASYIRRDGADTVRAIVRRWAPAADGNDDAAYVAAVGLRTGFGADRRLEADAATLAALTTAIIHHENGRCVYAPAVIAAAVDTALASAEEQAHG